MCTCTWKINWTFPNFRLFILPKFSFVVWLKVVGFSALTLSAWRDLSHLKNQFFQWVRFRVTSGILRAMFLFRQDFYYHHMLSQPVKICFLIIHSCSFNWSAFVASFFTLSWASDSVHSRNYNFDISCIECIFITWSFCFQELYTCLPEFGRFCPIFPVFCLFLDLIRGKILVVHCHGS